MTKVSLPAFLVFLETVPRYLDAMIVPTRLLAINRAHNEPETSLKPITIIRSIFHNVILLDEWQGSLH